MGGDSKSVRVLLDDGSVSEIPLEEAIAVEFSARKPKPHPRLRLNLRLQLNLHRPLRRRPLPPRLQSR